MLGGKKSPARNQNKTISLSFLHTQWDLNDVTKAERKMCVEFSYGVFKGLFLVIKKAVERAIWD